jgi:signal transduction histidine kinase
MVRFRSYRTKLQVAFLSLGLAAIGITGWVASTRAGAALRQATYDRLTAIRETRSRQIERFFEDAGNHVLALSSDESTLVALEQFRAAWDELPPTEPGSPRFDVLRKYYQDEFVPRAGGSETAADWFPSDPRARTLQYHYLAANPHPVGAKDLLLEAPGSGRYGRIHARYHPTFHRYQSAFGFYDIFLIEAEQGRLLYTVFKEIDLGASLKEDPFRNTGLARAFRRAMAVEELEKVVIEDYQPYPASYFAPAAFLAAPVWRAGVKIGVLAIQVSVDEVNRVMTGDRKWREEGLGETGQSYIVGPDGTLRSDLRFEIEDPEHYYRQLQHAGVDHDVLERIRRYRTAILNFRVDPELVERARTAGRGTEIGVDYRGVEVLRSMAPLNIAGLEWALIAEIDAAEALKAVAGLRTEVLITGILLASVFFFVAQWLANSVTRPVLALSQSAKRLGGRDFGIRIPVDSDDEIGQLAASFNRMAEDLERTTVSKEDLEVLAGRLITAQEDERSRLARELHDDLTQRLAAVAIEVGRLEKIPPEDMERWRQRLAGLKRQIMQLSGDVHGLARRLHPSTLDDLGLVAALESECRSFFERGGPPVDFHSEDSFDSLPKDTQLGLYRIVQEGLRNIYKHANAGTVSVRLSRAQDGVRLEIRDDGRGFDLAAPGRRRGLGLASMEERARLLGGHFAVQSRPGEGTLIAVTLPAGGAHE